MKPKITRQIKKSLLQFNSLEVHFLNLPQPLRDILVLNFKQYDVDTMASNLKLKPAVVKQWFDQFEYVEEMTGQHDLINRKNGNRWKKTPIAVKQEILRLRACFKIS